VASLVVSEPIYAGEQVTVRRFSDIQAEGIVGQLKTTMRAVQVPGDANQLLVGTLKTGDHVDLVANLRIDPNTDARVTRIVLRDLAVLSTPTTSSAPTSGQSASVLLAVTDTQVQRLFYVLKNGDWTFELRPAINSVDSPERIETLNSVLTGGVR
jgi:Flp pilus assembly protein CpaB